MEFLVELESLVVKKDIPKIGSTEWGKIKKILHKKLKKAPLPFGENLRTPLQKYRKLRVGNFRVIYRVEEQTVKIFIIEHRSVIYDVLKKRLRIG